MIVVFDIETAPNADRLAKFATPFTKAKPELTEFDPASVKLGAMKDEEKIAAKIEASRAKHVSDHEAAVTKWEQEEAAHAQNQVDKAALYPAVSEVIAIGWQFPGEEPVSLIVGDNVEDEKQLLQVWFKYVGEALDGARIHGHNLKFGFWSGNNHAHQQFDLNHLLWAAMRHGVPVPGEFHPAAKRFIDLVEPFFMFGPLTQKMEGYPSYLSLDNAVALVEKFGVVVDSGEFEDGMSGEWKLIPRSKEELEVEGATFHEWVEAGEFGRAREYLVNDIALTRAVADSHPFLG